MNVQKPRILILTTHAGGGHLNLAQSLQGILQSRYEVIINNPQSTFDALFYTYTSRHFTHFLKWQYILTDSKVASRGLHAILAMFSRRHIQRMIEEARPDLIIVTHAFLSYATARACARLSQSAHPIPLVFQLTDLGRLHMSWFTEQQADTYLAPTQEIFAQTLAAGIDRKRLSLTGRPIRQQFIEVAPQKRAEIFAQLNLDPARLTLFLQGGAGGSAAVDHTVEALLRARLPVQIILAVGNNQAIANHYMHTPEVYVLPFTRDIAPYMAIADIIAGKAGASFISEAFMLEKPFLATNYIPGQETANLTFIRQHNLGWVCLKPATQLALLMDIIDQPQLLTEKLQSICEYKKWNMLANQHILATIDALLPASITRDQELV
jgi:UDP-N-acetylglucosamine:LPS N-acetylglucosamine transferase